MDDQELQGLLARARQQDLQAVEQVIAWLRREWIAFVRGRLLKAGVPERDISNAVEEVFEEVWRYCPRFQGTHIGAFLLYVSRICRPVAQRFRPPAAEQLEPLGVPPPTSPPPADPSFREALCKALRQLPVRHVEAWILHEQGYELAELAQHLGCRRPRAKKLVDKAHHAIREWLTLFHLRVDIHLTPPHPEAGQQVETWLVLCNDGYADTGKLASVVAVDTHRLGRQTTCIPWNQTVTVRGFALWLRRPSPQQIVATVALGKKRICKTRVVDIP